MAGRITRKARVNVSHEAHEVNVFDVQPAHVRPLPQPRLLGVPNNPYGIIGTLNVDRDDALVNYRHKKLE